MFNKKDLAITITLEDGQYTLSQTGRVLDIDQERYEFMSTTTEPSKEIKATVTFKTIGIVTIGSVMVHIPNHPFRENNNLSSVAPISLSIEFEEQPKKLCATYQHRDWWSRPAFFSSYEDIPPRTQSLFVEGDTAYGYILPMVGLKTKSYLTKGDKDGVTFEMTAYTGGLNQIDDLCFLMAEGDNLYSIIEQVFDTACRYKKVPRKVDRCFPEMFEYFGWCSWDAFYTDITEQKVFDKVEELKEKKIPIRWILMDDGWLNTENSCLTTFEPDPVKFPHAFLPMLRKIKAETKITWAGVWHAFGGYWGGIEPGSVLAEEQKEHLYETKNGKLLPHFDPEKGFGFWKNWYAYLKDQGIDFVKVDGQSALKNYYKNNEAIGKVAAGAHIALENAVEQWMNGNIINCMGMAMENVFHRPFTCISRNSDDFVPNEEKGFREHMLQNAYNALYHDQMYVCDWDMYWTNHPDAKKHALVRAISGGPVYVSDRIGESSYEEIIPLVYHDGRILRMERSAKPSLDCIFGSPLENKALKLTNTIRGTGAVAAFHISEKADIVTARISPSDIYDLSGEEFIAFDYFKKLALYCNREDAITYQLTEKDYALVLFLPKLSEVTPIGLINKYMSAHAITSTQTEGKETRITLREGGEFAFYKAEAPTQITVNGSVRTKDLVSHQGYYSIDLSEFTNEVIVIIK
jgi:hypothetical protein